MTERERQLEEARARVNEKLAYYREARPGDLLNLARDLALWLSIVLTVPSTPTTIRRDLLRGVGQLSGEHEARRRDRDKSREALRPLGEAVLGVELADPVDRCGIELWKFRDNPKNRSPRERDWYR